VSRHGPGHDWRLRWVPTIDIARESKEEAVEFLPDTQAALNEYLSLTDPDLSDTLAAMSSSATRIVPDCVGLSLCLYAEDLTFTLVASNLVLAELDAMQYLEGGPCVDAVEENRSRAESVRDMLDEDRWQLFAQASAAAGVASTLSLPVLAEGRVMGGINLYAWSAAAFVGHHQELADALGASAVGAVTNADLGFHSRERAALAPGQLRDQQLIEVAVGILAAREHLEIEAARSHLSDAAARAGITVPQAARVVVAVHHP
jgi:GAF domain-containing protein